MTDSQQALFDRLAARVAARADLDLDTAKAAVDEALVQRGAYLAIVRAEVAAMIDEIKRPMTDAYQAMGQALHRAVDAAATADAVPDSAGSEVREDIRDHDRGLRMAAHHPDLVELDRLLNALYERPEPGTTA
ncbi:hypothetical protein OG552_35895 [Streptomyces sp. NBC_01476]|uniref:hypothetical protein n=1 Tax=Streptomyces sp. NBC_01476 TaxID=2903881 RepID=UPI002E332B9E|nr:hypothetical protein [Streptomyces sp. NBC_01476]